jgi:hypothetical protein
MRRVARLGGLPGWRLSRLSPLRALSVSSRLSSAWFGSWDSASLDEAHRNLRTAMHDSGPDAESLLHSVAAAHSERMASESASQHIEEAVRFLVLARDRPGESSVRLGKLVEQQFLGSSASVQGVRHGAVLVSFAHAAGRPLPRQVWRKLVRDLESLDVSAKFAMGVFGDAERFWDWMHEVTLVSRADVPRADVPALVRKLAELLSLERVFRTQARAGRLQGLPIAQVGASLTGPWSLPARVKQDRECLLTGAIAFADHVVPWLHRADTIDSTALSSASAATTLLIRVMRGSRDTSRLRMKLARCINWSRSWAAAAVTGDTVLEEARVDSEGSRPRLQQPGTHVLSRAADQSVVLSSFQPSRWGPDTVLAADALPVDAGHCRPFGFVPDLFRMNKMLSDIVMCRAPSPRVLAAIDDASAALVQDEADLVHVAPILSNFAVADCVAPRSLLQALLSVSRGPDRASAPVEALGECIAAITRCCPHGDLLRGGLQLRLIEGVVSHHDRSSDAFANACRAALREVAYSNLDRSPSPAFSDLLEPLLRGALPVFQRHAVPGGFHAPAATHSVLVLLQRVSPGWADTVQDVLGLPLLEALRRVSLENVAAARKMGLSGSRGQSRKHHSETLLSGFHRAVHRFVEGELSAFCGPVSVEHLIESLPGLVDIALPTHKVAVEVDGPNHWELASPPDFAIRASQSYQQALQAAIAAPQGTRVALPEVGITQHVTLHSLPGKLSVPYWRLCQQRLNERSLAKDCLLRDAGWRVVHIQPQDWPALADQEDSAGKRQAVVERIRLEMQQ